MPRGKSFSEYIDQEVNRDPEELVLLQQEFDGMRLSVALTRFREQRGLTQQALAHRCGIKQPMIARIERGQSPTFPTLMRLVRALQARLVADWKGLIALEDIEASVQPRRYRIHTSRRDSS